MNALWLLLVVAVCEARPKQIRHGIIGGTATSIDQVPWTCALGIDGEFYTCACTVIADTFVLTAAHCVVGRETTSLTVMAGETQLDASLPQELTKSFTPYPEYDAANNYHDIAVLETMSSLGIDGINVKAALLPSSADNPPDGATVKMTGYGCTDPTCANGPSPVLQLAFSLTISNADCQSRMDQGGVNNQIQDGDYCAQNDFAGLCNGDSGSPLTYDDFVIGIGNYGIGTNGGCDVSFPSVYNRVSYYKTWIEGQVG